MKYYVYQLIHLKTNKPFYIRKGDAVRAYTHNKFKDGNDNPYNYRIIQKLHKEELGIGRGVCFRHKNRTYGIFTAFPELI